MPNIFRGCLESNHAMPVIFCWPGGLLGFFFLFAFSHQTVNVKYKQLAFSFIPQNYQASSASLFSPFIYSSTSICRTPAMCLASLRCWEFRGEQGRGLHTWNLRSRGWGVQINTDIQVAIVSRRRGRGPHRGVSDKAGGGRPVSLRRPEISMKSEKQSCENLGDRVPRR